MAGTSQIHVIGAGLAGLSAAVASAQRGAQIVVYEAAKQAGGRCRSYHDSQLDMVLPTNGADHLAVLSGNRAVHRYLHAIGAEDRLAGSPHPEFGFFDVGTGRRWTVRPNDGWFPWWIFARARRVPGTRIRDYLALASLMRGHPGRRMDEVIQCNGVFWDKFLRPIMVSALNTAPEEATADLAGAVMRETLAKGGRHSRALLATPNLNAAFIDPALNYLKRNGTEVQFGRPLRAVTLEGDRLTKLIFDDGEETLGSRDLAILAVPPWASSRTCCRKSLCRTSSARSSMRTFVSNHRRMPRPYLV